VVLFSEPTGSTCGRCVGKTRPGKLIGIGAPPNDRESGSPSLSSSSASDTMAGGAPAAVILDPTERRWGSGRQRCRRLTCASARA